MSWLSPEGRLTPEDADQGDAYLKFKAQGDAYLKFKALILKVLERGAGVRCVECNVSFSDWEAYSDHDPLFCGKRTGHITEDGLPW